MHPNLHVHHTPTRHHHVHDVKEGHRTDPTGTRKIRAQYNSAMRGRLRRFTATVRRTLIENRFLQSEAATQLTPSARINLLMSMVNPVMDRAFATLDPNASLGKAYRKAVLDTAKEIDRTVPLRTLLETRQSQYTRSRRVNYNRQAHRRLAKDLQRDIKAHVKSALKANPKLRGKELSGVIADRVKKVGVNRARVIAATETVAMYADGTLDALQAEGYTHVSAEVEFTTASDSKVCPLCIELEGTVWPAADARGIIPRHPSCRCRWRPIARTSGNPL